MDRSELLANPGDDFSHPYWDSRFSMDRMLLKFRETASRRTGAGLQADARRARLQYARGAEVVWGHAAPTATIAWLRDG